MRGIGANLGLARRTITASVFLSLVIGAAFTFLGLAISGLRDAADRASHSQQVLNSANMLERRVIDIESGERGFVLTDQSRFLEPWFDGVLAFHNQADDLQRLAAVGSPVQGAQVRQIRQAIESYIRNYSIPVITTARRDPAAARTVAVTAQGERLIDALRARFARFMTLEHRILAARQDSAIADAHHATIAAGIAVGGSILLILFCGGYLVRAVVRPVRRASAMARRLAAGDLAARMPETGPAEVGVLEQSFNVMAGSLAASRDDLQRIAADQAALRRVATLVARGVPPSEVFSAVAAETGHILEAECTTVARWEPDNALTIVGSWSKPGAGELAPPAGSRWPAEQHDTAQPAQAQPGGRERVAGPLAAWARERGIRSSVSAPITAEGHLWGMVIAFAYASEQCPAYAESRILGFTELVAMAIANSESRSQLVASRARVVTAADKARRQIERNLHDGTQQRLISLALELRTTQARIPPEQADIAQQLTHTAQGLGDVAEELRQISQGLHPVLLDKGGLGPALRALARRSGLPVELNLCLEGRLPERVETTVYYIVAEALTNAAKHARASTVQIDLDAAGDALRLRVCDDGAGGANPSRGSGIIGLTDRVEALGGKMKVTSPAGSGTALAVTIPAGGLLSWPAELESEHQDHRAGRMAGPAGWLHGEPQPVAGGQPGGDHWPGPALAGGRQHSRGLVPAGTDQPQFVALRRRQVTQPGRGEDQRALPVGHDHSGRSPGRHPCVQHRRVPGGEHRRDLATALQVRVQAVLDGARGQREGPGHDHGAGCRGQRQPGRPRRPDRAARRHSGPGARRGPMPGQPGTRGLDGGRRQLPDACRGGQDLCLQRRGRPPRRHRGQPRSGRTEISNLPPAGGAPVQVPLEACPVLAGQGVQRSGARQGVRLRPAGSHRPTPRQSRNRIRPSRIRVLTVPAATPSSPATSR
jgi:signal transduction histidine kinase